MKPIGGGIARLQEGAVWLRQKTVEEEQGRGRAIAVSEQIDACVFLFVCLFLFVKPSHRRKEDGECAFGRGR